jgi:hypothetical protein
MTKNKYCLHCKKLPNYQHRGKAVDNLLVSTGFFNATNVAACEKAGLTPLLASKRVSYYLSSFPFLPPILLS